MRAAVRDRFGAPSEVVEVREVEKPVPTEDEVLVRVHAASLNFGDWYAVVGRPWIGRPSMGLRTPKSERLGTDYAGVVEAVGANVTDFRPGDEVFGGRSGALAGYVAARADRNQAEQTRRGVELQRSARQIPGSCVGKVGKGAAEHQVCLACGEGADGPLDGRAA